MYIVYYIHDVFSYYVHVSVYFVALLFSGSEKMPFLGIYFHVLLLLDRALFYLDVLFVHILCVYSDSSGCILFRRHGHRIYTANIDQFPHPHLVADIRFMH